MEDSPEDVGKFTQEFGASSIFLNINYEVGTNTRKSGGIIWETCGGGGPNYILNALDILLRGLLCGYCV